MQATIGIDIGTSAVKVVAVGLDGVVLAEANHPHPTLTPHPGWVEQRPADWWKATCSALDKLSGLTQNVEICGIGLSGQLNGMVMLDADDQCLGDAIIWLDSRAAAEAAELSEQFEPVLRQRAMTKLSAIAVLPKLCWLSRNDVERFQKIRSILFVKDYILWRLTGRRQTDPSDAAATGMMDGTSLEWIEELCVAAGVDKSLLPRIGRSTDIAGNVTPEAAKATGLEEGLPVAQGGGDVTALAVGCGIGESGVLGITLGTAGHVVLARNINDAFHTTNGLWRLPHATANQVLWLGLVMSGGLSLSWLHSMLKPAGTDFDFEDMVGLAYGVGPGANGISFVPFLEGAATPYSVPGARGAFIGLSSSSRAGDLVQAVMEGVAFNVRQCVELLASNGGTFTQIRVAEGGARVDRWCQIMADVLGHSLVRLETIDASSLGAALMAQTATTGTPLHELTSKLVQNGKTFRPDATRTAAYDDAYARYLGAVESEISRATILGYQ